MSDLNLSKHNAVTKTLFQFWFEKVLQRRQQERQEAVSIQPDNPSRGALSPLGPKTCESGQAARSLGICPGEYAQPANCSARAMLCAPGVVFMHIYISVIIFQFVE